MNTSTDEGIDHKDLIAKINTALLDFRDADFAVNNFHALLGTHTKYEPETAQYFNMLRRKRVDTIEKLVSIFTYYELEIPIALHKDLAEPSFYDDLIKTKNESVKDKDSTNKTVVGPGGNGGSSGSTQSQPKESWWQKLMDKLFGG